MAKKTPGKKHNSKSSNSMLSSMLTPIVIGALVISCCFGYLGLIERNTINTTSITIQAQSLADSQVALIDQALAQLKQRLSTIALSRELLGALQTQDQTVIDRYRQELTRAFPEADNVRIIVLGPLGIASLNKQRGELRNNIELDLVRHLSSGKNVEPEAYKLNDQWFFTVAEPVKSDDQKYANGALLVTLSGKYLTELLSRLDNSQGTTTLFQQFSNQRHLIASTGNNNAKEFSVTADTSVSLWQVSFTPSNELIARSSQSAMLIWVLLAASALTLFAIAGVIYTSLQRRLNSDIDLLMADKIRPHVFAIPSLEPLAQHIKNLHTQNAQKPAATKPAEPDKDTPSQTAAQAPRKPVETPKEKKPTQTTSAPDITLPNELPETIFRAYDIRGIAKQQLTNDVVFAIGLAIGSEALDRGQQSIVVAADGRHSSPQIRGAIVKGLLASGRDVIDIGTTPTPLMYFATHQLGTQSGVMITGSHNPADYNGIKVVIGGRALAGAAIQSLRDRIINKQLSTGQGEYRTQDIEDPYIDYIINDVAIAQPLKIVIDAGNGVAGSIAPRLFEELGCEVVPLYCDVDGDFPNHHPDPSVQANLQDLIRTVQEQEADLGIAFDGDGDRVAAVSASGAIIPADRLLMLLAQDVVSRNPGADVIFDVKCTRNLNTLISNYGGRPIMWKSGHSFMKEKMAETGALLGGEFSGHIFFKERWFGFDDGMYAAARLIEILSTTDPDLDAQVAVFPESISTPEISVATTDEQKFVIIEQLIQNNDFEGGKITTLDGVRVDFPDGWGLVRASNTTPTLVLRFEADTQQAMEHIQGLFKTQLVNIDNSLDINF